MQYSRSLKRGYPIMNNVLSLLGFARKAGHLVPGETLCEQGVKSKKISLLIIAEDLNVSTKSKMIKLCESEGVNYRVISDKESLSSAIGKDNYGLFGVTNKKFSRALIEKIDALYTEVKQCPKPESMN